jgi:anti-sigma B factor antagonist
MKLDITERDGVAVVESVPKKLDYTVCNDFQRQIIPSLEQGANKLLVDLSQTAFLDSCAIGTLITLRNRLLKTKGVIALCGITPQVAKIIKITDLHKVFEIYDDKEQALAAMAGA